MSIQPVGCHVKTLFKEKQLDVNKLQQIRDTRHISLSITSKCSLKCPYCVSNMFLPATQQLELAIDNLGIDEYLKRVLYFAKPYFPNISFNIPGSGEPTESPYFVRLATEFVKRGAKLNFQSNLHGIKNIEAFTSQFSKEMIQKQVTATISFHCGTYIDAGIRGKELRQLWLYDWLPRCIETGIKLNTVIVPMTPSVLHNPNFIKDYEYILKITRCTPALSELFHFYNDKHYPDAYTSEETNHLAEIQQYFHYGHLNLGFNKKILTCMGIPNKTQYLTNYIEVKGFSCASCMGDIEILADGFIRRCQSIPAESTIYGNICDPNYEYLPVILTDNPVICPANQCLCRSFGIAYCLQIYGITLDEYYHAWYLDHNKPEVAAYFQ